MRKFLLIGAAIVTLTTAHAWAEDDTVDTADGSLAVMGSGHVYQSTDGTNLGSWEGEDVTISSDGSTMFNQSSGEKADVNQVD